MQTKRTNNSSVWQCGGMAAAGSLRSRLHKPDAAVAQHWHALANTASTSKSKQ